MTDGTIDTYQELYAMARAEDWRDAFGKPLTIGWLMGYYDKHYTGKVRHSFALGSMADTHYTDGFLTAIEEIEKDNNGLLLPVASMCRLESMFGPYILKERDYHDGSGSYSTGVRE